MYNKTFPKETEEIDINKKKFHQISLIFLNINMEVLKLWKFSQCFILCNSGVNGQLILHTIKILEQNTDCTSILGSLERTLMQITSKRLRIWYIKKYIYCLCIFSSFTVACTVTISLRHEGNIKNIIRKNVSHDW